MPGPVDRRRVVHLGDHGEQPERHQEDGGSVHDDQVAEVAGEVLAVEEKQFKAELAELSKKAVELQQSLTAEEEKRKTYTPNIEARLLSQYERILKSREGLALV